MHLAVSGRQHLLVQLILPWFCLLALLAFIMFSTFTAYAHSEGLYRWVDGSGHVHFGDRPPASAKPTQVQVQVNTYHGTSIETLNQVFGVQSDSQRTRVDPVVMYSASWCGVCRSAKAYFVAQHIAYQDFDVERSDTGRRDFRELGGRGVPIILIGRQRLNGFTPAAFESARTAQR